MSPYRLYVLAIGLGIVSLGIGAADVWLLGVHDWIGVAVGALLALGAIAVGASGVWRLRQPYGATRGHRRRLVGRRRGPECPDTRVSEDED